LYCRDTDKEGDDLCPRKLKIIGLLICRGGDHQKAVALYDLIAKTHNHEALDSLSWTNQHFKHVFTTMFHLAFEIDTKIGGMKNEMTDMLEYVECKHILTNQFIDEVYGTESVLKRQDWIKKVAKEQNYLFSPKEIMRRLLRAKANKPLSQVQSIRASEYGSLPSES
jgi:hypothetical protein